MNITGFKLTKQGMLFFFMLTVIPACAQKEAIGGLKYYLYADTHEAVIDAGNTWSGELDIPSEVNYNGQVFTVSGMSCMAFSNCTELTRARIPKTIKDVIHHVLSDDNVPGILSPDNMNPFAGCKALESIEVDEDNPSMISVAGVLFSKDGTRLYCYPSGIKADSYEVPSNVTWIGAGAFAYNETIGSVVLPSALTKLGSGAFEGCIKLKEVNLPESLVHLEAYMFRECANLSQIEIPSCVTHIGEYTFAKCGCLNTIIIPESVTFIGGQFCYGNKMEAILIKGLVNKEYGENGIRNIFDGLDTSTVVYTLASEVERYQKRYKGKVMPLDAYQQTDISNNIGDLSVLSSDSPVIYNLQGILLNGKSQKGIYIQNGKKKLTK